jgi:thioredoxin-related protein
MPEKKLFRIIPSICLILLVGLSGAACADPPEGWEFMSLDKALKVAAKEQRRVFLYFGRHGCPACEKTNRESFSDPRVKEHYNDHYVLAYADSESGKRLRLNSGERITEMELGVKLKVFGTPFFYFMEPNGKPIMRAPGYQSADELLLFDRYVNEGAYKKQTLTDFKAANS